MILREDDTVLSFESIFGCAPGIRASAPGRVNLLGEHTDYNDGFVLPTAIPQSTSVAVGLSEDRQHHLFSAELHERVIVSAHEMPPPGFARYVLGCVRVLEREGHAVPPLLVHVTSSVPIGAGLSSSAALEVAMLRALRTLCRLKLTDVEIAELAQRAEIDFAGVQCGIMDQMASSVADASHLLFLDTRTLEHRLLPFPEGSEIVVLHSGVERTLAGSAYNERRAQCEEAARQLGVKALRDVTDPGRAASLPEPLRRRARHVITENNRVLEAVQGLDAPAFGARMNASHASLRDDYEVSVPAMDLLVEILQGSQHVHGARMTGAGFGGACVALVEAGSAADVAEVACEQYRRKGHEARALVPLIRP